MKLTIFLKYFCYNSPMSKAIILGIIQGITEFLFISRSLKQTMRDSEYFAE